jgi:hypothetical protein
MKAVAKWPVYLDELITKVEVILMHTTTILTVFALSCVHS